MLKATLPRPITFICLCGRCCVRRPVICLLAAFSGFVLGAFLSIAFEGANGFVPYVLGLSVATTASVVISLALTDPTLRCARLQERELIGIIVRSQIAAGQCSGSLKTFLFHGSDKLSKEHVERARVNIEKIANLRICDFIAIYVWHHAFPWSNPLCTAVANSNSGGDEESWSIAKEYMKVARRCSGLGLKLVLEERKNSDSLLLRWCNLDFLATPPRKSFMNDSSKPWVLVFGDHGSSRYRWIVVARVTAETVDQARGYRAEMNAVMS